MTRDLSFVYLTEHDHKRLKKYFPNDKHLLKELKSDGFKFGLFVDGKLIYCLIVCYGNNPKSAYITHLWTDGSRDAKFTIIKLKRMFDKLHKDWFVIFTAKKLLKFIKQAKQIDSEIYQYTGCIAQ
jgi:hypothetical protein